MALASVLAMRTEIIVLDEPTTGQDFRESVQIMEIVRKLNENGHTIIFITHDMSLVARYARRVLVLCRGEILADGDVRSVFAAPEILKRPTCAHPRSQTWPSALGPALHTAWCAGGVRELYELLVKMRREKIGCCN